MKQTDPAITPTTSVDEAGAALAHPMSQPQQSSQREGLLPVEQTTDAQHLQQQAVPQQPVDPDDSDEAVETAWTEPLPRAPKQRRLSRAVSERGQVGPPSRFRRRMLPIIIRLKAAGKTDAVIAQTVGISPSRFASWKREKPEIAEALAVGQEHLLDRVEVALTERALGWVGPAEKVLRDGRVVRHKQFHPPDTAAAMSVLTNKRSGDWKRNLEGNQGLALQVVINSPRIAAALTRHTEKEVSSVPQNTEEQE